MLYEETRKLIYAAIYSITNLKTGRVYIGETIDVLNRYAKHQESLRTCTHTNQSLQNDYLTYGYNNFTFRILEYIPVPDTLSLNNLHQYMKLRLVLLMREYYHQTIGMKDPTQYTNTYNKKFSLKEVHDTNLFPKRKNYGMFTYDQFEPYNFQAEIDKHKIISELKPKDAIAQISLYLSSEEKIPLKSGHSPVEIKRKPSPYSRKTVSILEEPYFLNSIAQDITLPTLNDYIKDHTPSEYSPSIIFYYLTKTNILLRNKRTPVNFPTEYSINQEYFLLSITSTKVYKVHLTDKGINLINKIIRTLPDWIDGIPTKLNDDMNKILLDRDKIDPFPEYDIMTPCKVIKDFL